MPNGSEALPATTVVSTRRGRPIIAWVALVLAGLLLLVSAFAVWVDRVALDTDTFVGTSTELVEDDAIRSAVATRAVDELYASVDVADLLEERLPEDFKSLSGPAAAGARQASYQIVERALERPALQRLWALAVEESHLTLVQVLEGGGDRVSTEEGVVTLNLRPIVLDTADRIGLQEEVEERLPADAGEIEVLRSDELDVAQAVFQLLETLAWLLPVLAIAAFALAVWLSGDRRRAVRRMGVTALVVGVVGLVAVRLTGNYLVDALVSESEVRTAAENAWGILTELLRATFRGFALIGLLILLAAWVAGPGRRAVAVRRVLAPVVRERVWAYSGLAVIALILLLAGRVDDFAGLLFTLVFIALIAVWIESTRTQTVQEFPDASAPELFADARARLTSWWEASQRRAAGWQRARPGAAAAEVDLTARLAKLAELHARGELSDEEYASAKARVLAGE
jgi:Short C-terminal domain